MNNNHYSEAEIALAGKDAARAQPKPELKAQIDKMVEQVIEPSDWVMRQTPEINLLLAQANRGYWPSSRTCAINQASSRRSCQPS